MNVDIITFIAFCARGFDPTKMAPARKIFAFLLVVVFSACASGDSIREIQTQTGTSSEDSITSSNSGWDLKVVDRILCLVGITCCSICAFLIEQWRVAWFHNMAPFQMDRALDYSGLLLHFTSP